MRLKQFIFALVAMLSSFAFTANAQVAKVGNTEYSTINEAIAAWTNGSTLTLLADVTLSDVVKLKSTEHHILNLGTYTMTAASGKHAIEITCEGRSSASYALTVNADATNPGGITAKGTSCIYYKKSGTTKDRPIILINNGVFNGSYSINSTSNGNTNCPQIWINGGVFNGNVNLTKNMLKVSGGTFHGWVNCTGDSSAYREIKGGRFKSWQFMTADAATKFWVGSGNGNYNVGVYVDAEGYLCVGGPVITELSAQYPAVASNYSKWSSYLKYSSAATYGLYYTNVDVAVKKHGAANVTIWVKPAVTIPENVAGDVAVVEEIKNNTALKDYTPANLPQGAELEIVLNSVENNKFVYDVTPMASGEEVEPAQAITFRLPVPASVGNIHAKVYHEGQLLGIYPIQGEGNAKYVEVSSQDFSEFTVEPVVVVAKIGEAYYETLADALNAAQAGDTIELLADVAIDEVTVTKSITINGNDHKVTPADATKTYNSAFMVGDSGWGDNHGETITINKVVFEGWKTTYGVVRAQGVTLAMDGCEFNECSVSNASYAVLSLNYTAATVENCKFVENTSRAIDVNYNGDASQALVIVDGCTFDGNSTTGAGIVMRSKGTMAVKNSTFKNNTVETNGNGATVYVGFGTGHEVSGCTFEGNTVTTSHTTTKRFASAIFCDGCVVNGNVFGEGNTATRNGESISTIVAVGAYYGDANLSANYWGGSAPVSGTDYTIEYTRYNVAVESYYADADKSNLITFPKGSNSPAYTKEVNGYVRVWGEGGGNAKESFELKLYSGETLMATTTLNNIGGIINGNVFVTWNFFYPSSDDEYWTTTWEEGHPNSAAQPTKVDLIIDGEVVATTDAVMSGADNLNPVKWAELGGVKYICTGLAGEGTEAEPFIINNIDDLKYFRASVNAGEAKYNAARVYVALAADIDLNNEAWEPIGTSSVPFKGVFDGKNHTISNLNIDGGRTSNIGFFGYTVDGEVKNLTINNATVSGRLNVAVVAGTPYTSKYTNINVTGHVEVNGMAYVGGVGGKNAYADWTNITVNVDEASYVNANSVENGTAYRTYVGGVIGFIGEGGHTFKNISSNIKVIGSTCDVGGVFGIAHYGNNFEGVTFTGSVEAPAGAEEVGGIAGVWHNEKGYTVTFTDCTSTGTVTVGDVTTTGSIVGGAYNAGNNIETNSGSLMIDGNEAWLKPAVAMIGEAKYYDLHEAMVAAKAGETVLLISDVDLAGSEWEPVSFKGAFDGQNHVISNLTINKPGVSNTGFIASLNGTFKNVTFTNPTVTGGECTGVVAGRAGGSSALAENITVNGTIKVETTHSGYARAAAIVGGWAYGNYKNITVDGGDKEISYIKHTGAGDGRYVAGIVGHADEVNSFVNCVVENITISGGWLCGGITGPGPGSSTVSGCAVDNININADYSGGLFGWYYGSGTVENSAISNVTFVGSPNKNGAIGGYSNNTSANVSNVTITNVKNINGEPLLNHVAGIGNEYFSSLAEAVAAVQEGETITIFAGTISEGTIKLPATLKNVTFQGAEGAVLKDMTISAADGNSYSYIGLTFNGITFDNSRILLTGWRNGEEVISDLAITNCTFKNLDDTTSNAPVHINKDAAEAVNGFTFKNNVIDGAIGGSKSGIYAQVTGNVLVENNVINNVAFRPYVIQVTTDDNIADNFVVKGNTFSGSAVGRAQGLGSNSAGTDNVNVVVSNNIFKGITDAQQICYWNFNDATTTVDLSGNYYDIDIMATPAKIYYNSAAQNVTDLISKAIFPIYTALEEDGTIDETSAFYPSFAKSYDANGEVVASYMDFESAIAAATAANSTIARIEVLSDYVQASVANTESYYDVKNDLTIASAEGANYTVKGCGFAIRVQDGVTLTIADNLTIEGLDVVANGFATSGENMVIDGTIKALSLKQWTSNGTITVNGKVELGYGDGQFDMAYGNGAVVVNGNGDKAVAQFKAGYSGTRGNGSILTINDTYFEAGAWFNVAGSNTTINVNNSLLKVSGGDAVGALTLASGNVINIDINSQVVAGNISGAGTINVDAEGLTEDVLVVKGNLSGFTGTINVEGANYEITAEGLVVKYDPNYIAEYTIDDAAPVDYVNDTEKTVGTLTYKRTLIDGIWNSLYVPFDIELTSDFLEDYDVAYYNAMHSYDSDNDGVFDNFEMEVGKLSEGTILFANYPYFIRPKNADACALEIELEDVTLYPSAMTVVSTTSVSHEFKVTGTHKALGEDALRGCYAISVDGDWAYTSGLKPHRFYLTIETRSMYPTRPVVAKAIRIVVRGEEGFEGTTGVESIEAPGSEYNVVYDLSGRRVEEPQKGGIYIVNGKKIVF